MGERRRGDAAASSPCVYAANHLPGSWRSVPEGVLPTLLEEEG
ncbi:MAG TPA: hypothetical protein VF195_05755 [Actinomycetota bacterium]